MPFSLIKRGFAFFSCILFTTPFIFISCKQSTCSGNQVDTVYIDPSAKSSVAYKGRDTLKFLNELNDTVTYIGDSVSRYFNSVSNSTACNGVNKRLEGYQVKFKTNNESTPSLSHAIYVSFLDDSKATIDIYFESLKYSLPYERLHYPWTKNMIINGVSYTDVLVVKLDYSSDSVYYSLKNGIIRLKRSDGRVLQKP